MQYMLVHSITAAVSRYSIEHCCTCHACTHMLCSKPLIKVLCRTLHIDAGMLAAVTISMLHTACITTSVVRQPCVWAMLFSATAARPLYQVYYTLHRRYITVRASIGGRHKCRQHLDQHGVHADSSDKSWFTQQ
jgi:hypothetical protein